MLYTTSCPCHFNPSIAGTPIPSSSIEPFLSIMRIIFIAAFMAVVTAQCPDYNVYSTAGHAPYSSGRFNLPYQRPSPECRTFNSSIVETTIAGMKTTISDPDLFQLFQNSYPNTLDTAIKWKGYANETDEELTFIITGDM